MMCYDIAYDLARNYGSAHLAQLHAERSRSMWAYSHGLETRNF